MEIIESQIREIDQQQDVIRQLDAANNTQQKRIDELESRIREIAIDTQSDYPNVATTTAFDQLWAIHEGFKGTRLANDDCHATIAALRSQLDAVTKERDEFREVAAKWPSKWIKEMAHAESKWLAAIAAKDAEIADTRFILQSALDREKDGTSVQHLAVIAMNGLLNRDDQIAELLAAKRELVEAAEYAAGSIRQVPRTQSLPPIVLHDLADKLEAAMAKYRS